MSIPPFSLWESNTPGIRYPSQIELSADEKRIIEHDLTWRDLDWKEIGDDGNSIIWLEMIQPLDMDLGKGVIVDIQLIQEKFYQIHINLALELRGIGLGTKIYRSIIDWAGHLYSGKGRRQNPIINKVWSKLNQDSSLECLSNDIADLCVVREIQED